MSTPTSTLPMKTDNITDQSDINDPVVQDVLNEFREELTNSKKKDEYKQSPSHNSQQGYNPMVSHDMFPPQHPPHPPHPQHPQHPQHPYQSSPLNNSYQSQPHHKNGHNQYSHQMYSDTFPYFNVDFDIIKKNLIIVIIALLIYNTGLINTLYEKAPEYLQDNLLSFDIYIRSITYFIVLYILYILEYL
jgi:hypothetical protein